jgi:hypothetical protein
LSWRWRKVEDGTKRARDTTADGGVGRALRRGVGGRRSKSGGEFAAEGGEGVIERLLE